MNHLDLFSGIGGFALAAKEVWGNGYNCIGLVEIDKYCQALLKRRFPGARIFGDIRGVSRERPTTNANINGQSERETKVHTTERGEQTFNDAPRCYRTITADTYGARSDTSASGIDCDREKENEGRKEQPQLEPCGQVVDLITGGFPCQPFSQAGKRRGKEDDRYLWPEMLRVIKEFNPRWVVAENVRGLLNISGGVVFNQVLSDLEAIGYEVRAYVIPACAVNAPHRRDRVWIVANSTGGKSWEQTERKGREDTCGGNSNVTYTNNRNDARKYDFGGWTSTEKFTPYSWEQNWLEVATELCGVDDGLPAELDGLKLSKSRHRVERLKALGNSIVPQVAVQIFRAIKESEGL